MYQSQEIVHKIQRKNRILVITFGLYFNNHSFFQLPKLESYIIKNESKDLIFSNLA